MMKILITEPDGYSIEAIELYRSFGDVILFEGDLDKLKFLLPSIDILVIKLKYVWNRDLLNIANSLKYIVTSTTGLNHIKLQKEDAFEIISLKGETEFLNTVTPTAELTWALLLTVMRNMHAAVKSVSNGIWDRDLFIGNELYGKTIGIIGYGRLGKMIGRYAVSFGMKVKVYDTDDKKVRCLPNGVESTHVMALLKDSDVISVHIPYENKNTNFLNKEKLKLVKKTAVLLNTSRGEVIDESYLLEMLDNNLIAGVALDVLADEVSGCTDWIQRNKLINSLFLTKNLIITPHIGGACFDSMQRTEYFVAKKIHHIIKGIVSA